MVSEDPIRSPESNDSKSGRPASLTEVDDEIGKTIDDENMETGMVSIVQGFLFFFNYEIIVIKNKAWLKIFKGDL